MRHLLTGLACALLIACALAQSTIPLAVRTAPTHWLVCHGDSITQGYGTTTYLGADTAVWSNQVVIQAVAAHPSYVFGGVNRGINGQGLNYVYSQYPSNTFGTLTADAVTRVDPILAQSGTKYLVIFAGTNDIFLNGTSGAATWTLLETYINARLTAGWTAANICVVTMLPRQGGHESDRTTYNSSIRSNAAGMGYKVADAGADSTIGDAGDENNGTYYLDTIHPIDAGHVIIANLVKAQLFP